MKTQTVSVLAIVLATSVASAAYAQRGRNNGGTPPRSESPRQEPPTPQGQRETFRREPEPQRPVRVTPSSPILPIGNPVAPMTNPVAPFVSQPFIRYSDGVPTLVIPDSARDGNFDRPGQRRGNRDTRVIGVPVPSYYSYPNYYYPEVEPAPATIPGQLPGARPAPGTISAYSSPAASKPVYVEEAQAPPEPRLIINEPRPDRVVPRPAIGTSKADVIGQLGDPWGTIRAGNTETLYFSGERVVIFTDGKVSQVR